MNSEKNLMTPVIVAECVLYFTVEHGDIFLHVYCNGDIKRSEEGSQYIDHIYDSYTINKEIGLKMAFVDMFHSVHGQVLSLQRNGVDIEFMYDTKENFENLKKLV
jgi:hypothetical protein